MPVRILIADGHALVRAGLHRIVAAYAHCEVVGEAADGRAVLQLARALLPDVVLLEISMPGLNGIDCVGQLAKLVPGTKTILVSMHATEQYVLDGLRAGAHGYVHKDAAPAELEQAIRSVVGGGRYVSQALTGHLFKGLRDTDSGKFRAAVNLTLRQREILQLIAEGHSSRVIGERLHLAAKTVDGHRAELMRRLNIHDVAGLTKHAIRLGLIKLE